MFQQAAMCYAIRYQENGKLKGDFVIFPFYQANTVGESSGFTSSILVNQYNLYGIPYNAYTHTNR